MKMGRLEKLFINSERHAAQAIERADRLLGYVDMDG